MVVPRSIAPNGYIEPQLDDFEIEPWKGMQKAMLEASIRAYLGKQNVLYFECRGHCCGQGASHRVVSTSRYLNCLSSCHSSVISDFRVV